MGAANGCAKLSPLVMRSARSRRLSTARPVRGGSVMLTQRTKSGTRACCRLGSAQQPSPRARFWEHFPIVFEPGSRSDEVGIPTCPARLIGTHSLVHDCFSLSQFLRRTIRRVRISFKTGGRGYALVKETGPLQWCVAYLTILNDLSIRKISLYDFTFPLSAFAFFGS